MGKLPLFSLSHHSRPLLPFSRHESASWSASIKEFGGVNMARKSNRMHPGRVLREEFMEPMDLEAKALGVPASQITPVLADQEPLTSDLALRLARCFRGTSPQFWLGLQTAFDLAVAQARFGAEIEKVQPLAA